jgi:hypothetical protein
MVFNATFNNLLVISWRFIKKKIFIRYKQCNDDTITNQKKEIFENNRLGDNGRHPHRAYVRGFSWYIGPGLG